MYIISNQNISLNKFNNNRVSTTFIIPAIPIESMLIPP